MKTAEEQHKTAEAARLRGEKEAENWITSQINYKAENGKLTSTTYHDNNDSTKMPSATFLETLKSKGYKVRLSMKSIDKATIEVSW